MSQVYFITGTDTDAGKTHVCCAIMKTLQQRGKSVIGLKPVAAGADLYAGQLENDDAVKLLNASSKQLAYDQVNPFCFQQAIAPHIAAEQNQSRVTLEQVKGQLVSTMKSHSEIEYFFVEGAGGWLVPLNDAESFAEIPAAIKAKVILVVAMKLGCINHALLSAQSILNRGVNLVGWVANQIDPDMAVYQENLLTLQRMLPCPILGELKHNETQFSELVL